jgi:hypothetical protein
MRPNAGDQMSEVCHRQPHRPAAARGPVALRSRSSDGGRRSVARGTEARAVLSLQRSVGNAGIASLIDGGSGGGSAVRRSVGGVGRALDEPVRRLMERRFAADFADVRIHADEGADRGAHAVGADAYTVGAHIAFRRDRYRPDSAAGLRVLAHELAHVLQQRRGPVTGHAAGDGTRISDPGDRFEREADRVAGRVMAGSAPELSAGPDPRAVPATEHRGASNQLHTRREHGCEGEVRDSDLQRPVSEYGSVPSNPTSTRDEGGDHADLASR